MKNEGRGNYFDQWERRDVLDPRDLIPVKKPVEFGTVGVIDIVAFEGYFGPINFPNPRQEQVKVVVEEHFLVAA